MGKHRNANGTYDGVGVLSDMTNLSPTEILSILEKVKANHAKLDGCSRHDFEIVPLDQGLLSRSKQVYRCEHCGGEIDGTKYRWHEIGRGNSQPDT